MEPNLRMLVYANPMAVDKIAKKFQFWRDSGFIYSKQLIASLPSNWGFYWCIPDKIKPEEYVWFREANRNVWLIPYPYTTSIHQNRYNFSMRTLNNFFDYGFDIDGIINNQPEVTTNFKVWANNQRRESPPVFSYYHWIDCRLSRAFAEDLGGYIYPQADGAMHSELIFFHNEYAHTLFKDEVQEVYFPYKDTGKVRYFHPRATIYPIEPFETGIPDDKKIILFNHRLNSTTRWKEVVLLCDEIYKERQDFILWMTDDSKTQEFEFLKQRKYIRLQSLKDGEYGYILSKAHFAVCNHRGYSTWNMAVLDAFANGCLTLIPNREVYQDMFALSIAKYKGYFSFSHSIISTPEWAFEGSQTLGWLINHFLDNDASLNRRIAQGVVEIERSLFQSPDGGEIETAMKRVFKESSSTTPKKYEEVLNYIRERGEISKKDWVNKFWSFHVNNNFPLIRRKLLMEGDVIDDTSRMETVYIKTG